MLITDITKTKIGEWFTVPGECEADAFRVDVENGYQCIRYFYNGKWSIADGWDLSRIMAAAPSGIIHLPPPLTDEQREQLKAIWTLGGRWLAKDCDGVVNYYTKIPYKESGYWFDNDDAERYGYAIPLSAGVCELQELNKADEPFDIGKALGVGE